MNKRELFIRVFLSIVGVFTIALGAAILNVGNVGVDAFTASNISIGKLLGLSLGTYQILINCILLVLVLIFGKKYIGIGTFISMVAIGFFIDTFSKIMSGLMHFHLNIFLQIIFLISGTLVFTFGIACYITANIGIAPYDAVTLVIQDRTKIKYKYIRISQDLIFMFSSLVLMGPVGVGTIVNAFFNGPLIEFWNNKATTPLLNKLLHTENYISSQEYN